MKHHLHTHRRPVAAIAAAATAVLAIASAPFVPVHAQTITATTDRQAIAVQKRTRPDHSGKARTGKASYYADSFAGRKMADGARMDPRSHNAASRTLPLGTRAVVTNLENGRSAVVTIRDRGPYVDDRIVDLSPRTARELDMIDDGVAPVEVAPIVVPLPDGTLKPGVAAHDLEERLSSR